MFFQLFKLGLNLPCVTVHVSTNPVIYLRALVLPQEENHARAENERRKQEQRLRERNRRQREIAEERRLRELKKKVLDAVPPRLSDLPGTIDWKESG